MDVNRIRKDFPILNKGIKGKQVIYFDNACMSLRPIQVIDKINQYYKDYPACGVRSLHKLSKKVTEEVEKSRLILKKFFNTKKDNEIIFTKNTTESINLISHSLNFKEGDIVLTTDKEHNSNLLPWLINKKIKHDIVKSDEDNTFNIEKFKEKLNKNVKLVSMVHTSNLDGYTLPAKEIIKIAHDNNSLVLLDSAQSAPHKEINIKKLDVDFLACSIHKMLGPSGVGVLYGKEHLLEELNPFMLGGETVSNSTYNGFDLEKIPERFEAGLQNYAGIIGSGEAAKYLIKVRQDLEKHEIKLNKIITNGLEDLNIDLIGPKPELRSGIISFNIKGLDPHNIALMLDTYNIMVRSGMHCVHSWFNAHNINGSVRASLYLYNTEEECNKFLEVIKKITKIR